MTTCTTFRRYVGKIKRSFVRVACRLYETKKRLCVKGRGRAAMTINEFRKMTFRQERMRRRRWASGWIGRREREEGIVFFKSISALLCFAVFRVS